jgi:uncharacterized RDD family membrane protein YckC
MESAIESQQTPRCVGVAPRAVATLIDAIVSLPIFFVASFLLGNEHVLIDEAGGTIMTVWEANVDVTLVWITLTLAYFISFEAWFGATVGKLVLGLRVRESDGSPIGLDAAFLRNVMRIVDCFPYVALPYLLGAVSVWAGKDRQRLGDRVADTIVTWR